MSKRSVSRFVYASLYVLVGIVTCFSFSLMIGLRIRIMGSDNRFLILFFHHGSLVSWFNLLGLGYFDWMGYLIFGIYVSRKVFCGVVIDAFILNFELLFVRVLIYFGGLFRVLCKYFAHGACLKGEYCEFSHDWTAPPSNVNITFTPLCYHIL